MSIVVDAKGMVSEARALSEPPELVPAAIASAKAWQFYPPSAAPVTHVVEVSYGFPKECSGPVSTSGSVKSSGRLVDANGNVIAVWDDNDYPLPPYPEEERKAGAVGKMILTITLDADGEVKEMHIIKSLSSRLDKAAMDTVHGWKFKLVDRNPNTSTEDLRLTLFFIRRAQCLRGRTPHS